MRTFVADCGVGNIHSIRKALEVAGLDVETVSDMSRLADADCVVLPGVGAFDAAMGRLAPHRSAVRERLSAGVPALGVCVGAQVLLERSEEGEGPGIGLVPGEVRFLQSETVPHMGWNTVEGEDPLLEGVGGSRFYFAHSYYCDPGDRSAVRAGTEYEGFRFPSLMRSSNTVGVQFHPEKSADAGMAFLRAFAAFAEDVARSSHGLRLRAPRNLELVRWPCRPNRLITPRPSPSDAMIVIPAVDVLDHRVVQLVGGVPGSQRVDLPDPLETAMGWTDKGAERLHLVDLDGAFGKGDNVDAFRSIIKECKALCQVGGGIRSEERIEEYVKAGADRVVLGTKAVEDPEWLRDMTEKFPGKIVLGLDTRGGRITVKGWREDAAISVEGMLSRIGSMPLAGVLNTNVDVEGRGRGIDGGAAASFISRCPKPVIASGGVSSAEDLRILSDAGAVAAVVGMAVYKGEIRPWEWEAPWRVRIRHRIRSSIVAKDEVTVQDGLPKLKATDIKSKS